MSPRRGRRPGDSGTREAILEAATAAFTENGYDNATIRDVARRAKVDPALVHHYYGTKQELFSAAMDVHSDPVETIAALVAGDPDTVGVRIVETFLTVWDDQATPLVALVRSAASNPQAATMFREFITQEILGRVTAGLHVTDAAVRGNLVASQMLGVAVLRYVIGLEPIASMPRRELAELVGPTIHRYLYGELPQPGSSVG